MNRYYSVGIFEDEAPVPDHPSRVNASYAISILYFFEILSIIIAVSIICCIENAVSIICCIEILLSTVISLVYSLVYSLDETTRQCILPNLCFCPPSLSLYCPRTLPPAHPTPIHSHLPVQPGCVMSPNHIRVTSLRHVPLRPSCGRGRGVGGRCAPPPSHTQLTQNAIRVELCVLEGGEGGNCPPHLVPPTTRYSRCVLQRRTRLGTGQWGGAEEGG